MAQSDVPHSRRGKHNKVVNHILGDVEKVSSAEAVKIPRRELDSTIEKVRSALSRASRGRKLEIATAPDSAFLYVWRKAEGKA